MAEQVFNPAHGSSEDRNSSTVEAKRGKIVADAKGNIEALQKICTSLLKHIIPDDLKCAIESCRADVNAMKERKWYQYTKEEWEGLGFDEGFDAMFRDADFIGKTQSNAEEAVALGLEVLQEILLPTDCSGCGCKTHHAEENGEKTPLTVRGEILHGRCIRCFPFAGGYSPSEAASLASVTFVATTNKVKATRVQEVAHPCKQVIGNHEAFLSAFNIRPPRQGSREAKEKKMKVEATIVQCSSSNSDQTMVKCPSGLVSTVLRAYNKHHNLVLRPDDVWQAILNQFSLYLVAHAEQLRGKVVDFDGQRSLKVKADGNLFDVDFGDMAARMVHDEIVKNIKDPDVVLWLTPSFSTTTQNDRVAASVSVMSAMQKYFKYKFELACGIPCVTLLGTPGDWIKLRSKIDGLLQFELPGETNIEKWHGWLAYIGDNFVKSSQGNADVSFWDRIASHHGGGSGPRYVSGWISTFCVWSDDGLWQGEVIRPMGAACRIDAEGNISTNHVSDFPLVNTNDLTSGVVSVPVLVDDNGTEYECKMFSGQFGMHVHGDTVSPKTDWCIATVL